MIFPKNEHLKITMYFNSILGVWPFIFENNPTLRKVYRILFYCSISYYMLFTISAIVELIIIFCDDVLDSTALMNNLGVTLVILLTLFRVKAIKTDRVKKIVRKIFLLEKKILNSEDDKIIKIYKSQAVENKICNKMLFVSIYILNILFLIQPLYLDDVIKYNPKTNETIIIRPLPLSVWFPFDQQEHYVRSYIWQEIFLAFGATFVAGSDIFACSLIIFGVGQIKILKSILSNFQEYSLKVKDQLNCSQEEASFITIRECILKHKEIIEYIDEYNLVMKNLMIFDFLLSSLQMASVVLGFFMTRITLLNFIFTSQYAFSMLLRLFINYWYANEITVNSAEIGMALYSSEWYEEPLKVKKLMVIMLMRCTKELYLQIGPFGVMTLGTFLGILKATYSYMTIMYK